MNLEWTFMIDFALLSLFLGLATYLKRSFTFFQKYLIPNAIIAGFIGMILGPEILNLAKLNPERLGTMVYHLMALGFIALALKDRARENTGVGKTGVFIVTTYLLQGIIGFGLTLGLVYTIYPDLFPAFGLLLPLGFGQGPGQAFSIGNQWEGQGFLYGGNIGLTIAALGFLWACLGGIPLMNYLIRRKKMVPAAQNSTKPAAKIFEEDDAGDMPLSESMDRITVQFFLIGIVYLAMYGTLVGATILLEPLGTFGHTLAQLLWGFHFIIGSMYAVLLRIIFDQMKKRKIMIRNYPNNYLLQRISGGCFDFMITASIAAISLKVVGEFIVPIALISTIGGLATIWYCVYICKKIYKEHTLEYILALYGMLTGTISTGLALLREIDPNFETPAAENMVLGSGIGLFFGFPLMAILNLPVFGYVSGKPIMYYVTLAALVLYMAFLLWVMLRHKGSKATVQVDSGAGAKAK